MSKYQPPGRLSKVSGSDYMIQIQTEYAWTPHPRITTSVVLDGVIIHKIQKNWQGDLESDEERRVVQQLINKQHDEVESIIESNRDLILNYSLKQEKKTDFGAINSIEGVKRALLLTTDGVISPFNDDKVDPAQVKMFEQLFELIEVVDYCTRLGTMEEAYLVVDEDRIMIFKYKDNYLIVTIEEKASPRDTAKRIVDFLKAA